MKKMRSPCIFQQTGDMTRGRRPTRRPRRRRRGEDGMTMLTVMTVLAILSFGMVLGVNSTMVSLASTGRTTANRRAYNCAEAGLNAGAAFFRANESNWNQYIETSYVMTGSPNSNAPGLTYVVGISDDRDEFVPDQNNPHIDGNQTVLLRSTCTDVLTQEMVVRQRWLSLTLRRPGSVRVRPGAVTYTATNDFTASGGIPDCNGCGEIDGTVPGGSATSTSNSGFTAGGVKADGVSLRGDQIALAQKTAYPFIWLPDSQGGTISKYNTVTGKEMARYRTGPNKPTLLWGNPSRTTVDLEGNVWVTNRNVPIAGCSTSADLQRRIDNRQLATVVKIGLFEAGGCIDRNGDGIITTSTGPSDVKDWTAGWAEGIIGAQDECIVLNVALAHPRATSPCDARMVAVDARNNLYVGGNTTSAIYHLDGDTGRIKKARNVKRGHYGGVLSRDGYIWSNQAGSDMVEKIDPGLEQSWLYPTGISGKPVPAYGIAIDVFGKVWISSWTANFSRRDPDGSNLQVYSQGNGRTTAQGITTNAEGDVFIAGSLSSPANHVGHYDKNGTFLREYQIGTKPTGVAIDAAGKLWAAGWTANTNASSPHKNKVTAARIDLSTGKIDEFPIAGPSYTYSDVTGYVVKTVTAPSGTWTVTQDCGTCTNWRSVAWTAYVPTRTNIEVRARSAADPDLLKTKEWIDVDNDRRIPATGDDSLRGRFIQVEVKLIAESRDDGATPIIYDVTITPDG